MRQRRKRQRGLQQKWRRKKGKPQKSVSVPRRMIVTELKPKGRQRRSVKPKRRKEKLKLMGMGRMDSTSSLGQ